MVIILVELQDVVIKEELKEEGLGWVYVRHCKLPLCAEWQSLELADQAEKRGLWGHSGEIPPWEFRRQKKR